MFNREGILQKELYNKGEIVYNKDNVKGEYIGVDTIHKRILVRDIEDRNLFASWDIKDMRIG